MNLNQITVPVSDVERSISFYEKLGLRLIVKSIPNYARFECPEGNSTFSLHQVDVLPTGEGIWVYFEVQQNLAILGHGVHRDILVMYLKS